jgi:calcineurin-like phosphoesterase family protein
MDGHNGYMLDGYKTIQPIPNYFEIWYKKQFLVLSHYPIGSWNKVRKGSFNLFGHCHGTYKNSVGKQLDVGFDNFPVPPSFEDVQRILNKKKIEDVDGTHTGNFWFHNE